MIIFVCLAEDSLTPPLPDRTPESFIIPTEESEYLVSCLEQKHVANGALSCTEVKSYFVDSAFSFS